MIELCWCSIDIYLIRKPVTLTLLLLNSRHAPCCDCSFSQIHTRAHVRTRTLSKLLEIKRFSGRAGPCGPRVVASVVPCRQWRRLKLAFNLCPQFVFVCAASSPNDNRQTTANRSSIVTSTTAAAATTLNNIALTKDQTPVVSVHESGARDHSCAAVLVKEFFCCILTLVFSNFSEVNETKSRGDCERLCLEAV